MFTDFQHCTWLRPCWKFSLCQSRLFTIHADFIPSSRIDIGASQLPIDWKEMIEYYHNTQSGQRWHLIQMHQTKEVIFPKTLMRYIKYNSLFPQ